VGVEGVREREVVGCCCSCVLLDVRGLKNFICVFCGVVFVSVFVVFSSTPSIFTFKSGLFLVGGGEDAGLSSVFAEKSGLGVMGVVFGVIGLEREDVLLRVEGEAGGLEEACGVGGDGGRGCVSKRGAEGLGTGAGEGDGDGEEEEEEEGDDLGISNGGDLED
jgi:hypothetical protein